MYRLLIVLPVLLVMSVSPADAARHKKVRVAVRPHAPAYAVQPNRPPWAAPQQCFTDDGYGRYLPCDVGDGR